jgi:hypothetical protein
VQTEAADELDAGQGHRFDLVAIGVVLIADILALIFPEFSEFWH